jgi:hypothetical protein
LPPSSPWPKRTARLVMAVCADRAVHITDSISDLCLPNIPSARHDPRHPAVRDSSSRRDINGLRSTGLCIVPPSADRR